jgi:hypothetical protein
MYGSNYQEKDTSDSCKRFHNSSLLILFLFKLQGRQLARQRLLRLRTFLTPDPMMTPAAANLMRSKVHIAQGARSAYWHNAPP